MKTSFKRRGFSEPSIRFREGGERSEVEFWAGVWGGFSDQKKKSLRKAPKGLFEKRALLPLDEYISLACCLQDDSCLPNGDAASMQEKTIGLAWQRQENLFKRPTQPIGFLQGAVYKK
ncbi:hypothetical protein BgiMline_015642 [Biomphalaria glabrata]|nr:hypothetical protein BgiMline_008461 [Biomphalaria glabrata]KAI8791328.1 hypothetical protein BgiBS90_006792 [Biomphalaria glabrata]